VLAAGVSALITARRCVNASVTPAFSIAIHLAETPMVVAFADDQALLSYSSMTLWLKTCMAWGFASRPIGQALLQ
jgi:hypothetical protein